MHQESGEKIRMAQVQHISGDIMSYETAQSANFFHKHENIESNASNATPLHDKIDFNVY